jgi:hypothetical protein
METLAIVIVADNKEKQNKNAVQFQLEVFVERPAACNRVLQQSAI